jgi:hypothetical protein
MENTDHALAVAAHTMRNTTGGYGETIGSYFGKPGKIIGGAVGSAAGQLIARLTGMGKYVVKRNTLSEGASSATFATVNDGVVMRHREFLGNVSGSVLFETKSYSINPGIRRSFPYLSQLACYFEEYEIAGIVYQYVPTSGMVTSVSPALGSVIMATQYDAYDPVFPTKQDMESYMYATSCVPFTPNVHVLECDPSTRTRRGYFTRSGQTPPGSLLDYDFGNFTIATEGFPSVYVCGELWVSYDIRLRKPRINSYCLPPCQQTVALYFTRMMVGTTDPGGFYPQTPDPAAQTVTIYDGALGAGKRTSYATTPTIDQLSSAAPSIYFRGGPLKRSYLYIMDPVHPYRLTLTQPGTYRLRCQANSESFGPNHAWLSSASVNTNVRWVLTGGSNTVVATNASSSSSPYQFYNPAIAVLGLNLIAYNYYVTVIAAGTGQENEVDLTYGADLTSQNGIGCIIDWSVEQVPDVNDMIAV